MLYLVRFAILTVVDVTTLTNTFTSRTVIVHIGA